MKRLKKVLQLLLFLHLIGYTQNEDDCLSLSEYHQLIKSANPSIAYPLVPGWNMVGYMGSAVNNEIEAQLNASLSIGTASNTFQVIKNVNGEFWSTEYAQISTFTQGEGYMMYVNSDPAPVLTFSKPLIFPELPDITDCLDSMSEDYNETAMLAYALGAASVVPEDGISQLDIAAAIDSVNAVWMSIPTPFSSAQGVTDMAAIYQDLSTYEGGTPHALVFGGGEVLYPGVYDVTGAASISIGSLTLDGGGDPNSVFIIRSTGAFTTGVGATIILTNGANSRNIFWMSEAAISTAANTIIKGTFVSPAGAIALGAGTLLEGRMFTKLGALTTVTGCNVTIPLGDSPIDLGLLSSFAMWTSGGAISDAATSTTIGDVGTASGALTISGSLTGVEYPAGTE